MPTSATVGPSRVTEPQVGVRELAERPRRRDAAGIDEDRPERRHPTRRRDARKITLVAGEASGRALIGLAIGADNKPPDDVGAVEYSPPRAG
jgi:hypothetical protein